MTGVSRAFPVLLLGGTVLLSACGPRRDSPVAGTLTVAASGACLALAHASAEAFQERYPEAHVHVVQAEGFRATEALMQGTVGLVVQARGVLPEETQAAGRATLTLHATAVAVEGIAVVVHPSNHMTSLAQSSLNPIIDGAVRRWTELRAAGDSLQVFAPEPGTGTGSFVAGRSRNITRSPVYFVESDSAVVAEVARRPQSLGFVGSGYLVRTAGHHPVVHVVDILPEEPGAAIVTLTQASLAEGSYPLTSAVSAITRGEPDGLAAGFLAFMTSQPGQRAIERAGLAPVSPSSVDVHLR